jgi:hypothetical protein
MTHRVNWAALADALDMACEIRDVSLRDVATEIGISPSGLTRLRQGLHLSADGVATLVAWLYPQRIPHWIEKAT